MKRKQVKDLPVLPPPASVRSHGMSAFGAVGCCEYTGKFTEESRISYVIALPRIAMPDFGETQDALETAARHFLFFLQTESRKKRDGVIFGALSFRLEKTDLILSCAFCPFGQKTFQDVARLALTATGGIKTITLL